MDNNTENLIKELNEATSQATSLATQFHLQSETMAELQKEERQEMREQQAEERAQMRKHYENIVHKYTRIIFGLIATLIIILGGIIGAAVYVLSNYEFEFGSYQLADVGGDGTANIYDGIHYNDTSNAD